MRRRVWTFLAVLATSCASPPAGPRPLGLEHLDNAHEIAPGVLTGSGPRGGPSFQELAARGVRTVISVDGVKPDVVVARAHGLRYVHLPIGYDGVPAEKTLALAKALRELPGSIYVHCHHGKHRGPTFAAVACVAAGKLDNEGALRVLKTMGTGENYLGLWASAREAKAMDTSAEVAFLEVAPVPPLMEAMVALDEILDHLSARPAEVDPAHEALRAREIATEILRTDDFKGRPADYQAWMREALEAATELEVALRAGKDVDLRRLRKSCADCHKPYRNTPRKR